MSIVMCSFSKGRRPSRPASLFRCLDKRQQALQNHCNIFPRKIVFKLRGARMRKRAKEGCWERP
jgi:hypothetical protein